MPSHSVVKLLVCLTLSAALIISGIAPAYGTTLTQRDWITSVVDTLGWSFGLPDEPQDPDYINILLGNRSFRLEAEDIYNQETDNVTLMTFINFGPYSGRGWLQGPSRPTETHLRFTLPIGGTYQLRANLFGAGHRFIIDGQTTAVDGTGSFAETVIGSFTLDAGPHEIVAVLPSNGAIDYISLQAATLAAIAPGSGWQPDEPLTWDVIDTSMLQLLQLADAFPPALPAMILEAESIQTEEAKIVSIEQLGKPSDGKWLRAGSTSAQLRLPFELQKSGFYDMSIRVKGSPIEFSISEHQELTLDGQPYLEDIQVKNLYLLAGSNNVSLLLPPGGGFDSLTLTARKVSTDSTATLLGLDRTGPPTGSDLDRLTALLAAFGVTR